MTGWRGQVAQNVNGELVGPGDPAAQARQVFENLGRCLAEVGEASGKLVIASRCARHRMSVTIGA